MYKNSMVLLSHVNPFDVRGQRYNEAVFNSFGGKHQWLVYELVSYAFVVFGGKIEIARCKGDYDNVESSSSRGALFGHLSWKLSWHDG